MGQQTSKEVSFEHTNATICRNINFVQIKLEMSGIHL